MNYTINDICKSFLQQNKDKFPNVTVDKMLRINFFALGHNQITNVSINEVMYEDKNYDRIAYYLLTPDRNSFVGTFDIASLMSFLKEYVTPDYCFKYSITEEGLWLDVYYYNEPTLEDLVKRFDTVLTSHATEVIHNKQPKNRKEEILEQIRALNKELEELDKLS